MSSSANKYPQFELLEIERELQFGIKKYRSLTPLKKNDTVPDLSFLNDVSLWQQYVNGGLNYQYFSVKQLLNKPLVVAFFSEEWNEDGLAFIKQLNELNTEIKANGGNLVVVTPGRNSKLEKLAWDNNLTLNFYFDEGHELASKFGVYHKQSPVWERFSGVDADVALLATYVVNPFSQVTFAYSNWQADKVLDKAELIEEVYQSGLYLNSRRSA